MVSNTDRPAGQGPSPKSPAIADFLEANFGRTTAITDMACSTCPAQNLTQDSFRTPLDLREYRISGMCQACQDAVFGAD